MKCVLCGYPRTLVVQTREYKPPSGSSYITRRRRCVSCARTFVTKEALTVFRMTRRGELRRDR